VRYPTDNNRETSGYGYRMITNPETGKLEQDFHGGKDYGAIKPRVTGDPVYPIVNNSKVMYVGFDRWRGKNVILQHDSHCTRYNHLKEVLVSENDLITEETTLGLMGTSGNSTGAHLHFEVHACMYAKMFEKWPNGEYKHTIDPDILFLEYMENSNCKTDELIGELEEVINKYK